MPVVLVLLLAWIAPAFAETVVFRNFTLIDGTGKAPVSGMSLIVTDGKITSVGPSASVKSPAGAQVVDLSGKHVMPGIINLHGHVGLPASVAQEQLRTYARYGVTTVVSLGTDLDEMFDVRAAQSGRPDVARLYTAGRGFILKAQTPNPTRFAIDSVAEVKPRIDELAAKKADFIKMWVDDNFGRGQKLSPEITSAIIAEAHKHGIKAVAHIVNLADAKQLIAAGLDGLAHSVRDKEVDAELIAMMKSKGAWQMAPTLTRELSTYIYAERPRFLDEPFFTRGTPASGIEQVTNPQFMNRMKNDPDFERNQGLLVMAKRNLKKLSDAGVKIGFGTDTGPTGRFQGYFEHLEMELMVDAGLSPMQVLTAATKNGAEFLGARDRGTLEAGRWADMLVLSKNPLEDIRNTRSLEAVWIAGKLVK
jgi:imidazolonepropionase-like amidohydrolase